MNSFRCVEQVKWNINEMVSKMIQTEKEVFGRIQYNSLIFIIIITGLAIT